MEDKITKYFDNLRDLLLVTKVTDKEKNLRSLPMGIGEAIELITKQSSKGKKIIFIGNGASAAIASHMAIDFWKNARIKAITFTDPALLTALSNDFRYEEVFAKPIEMFAEKGDILVAISSSGQSENILQGVEVAREKDCKIITLSGFKSDNPLRKLGDLNFYLSSDSYGLVETSHQAICHCILDLILEQKK